MCAQTIAHSALFSFHIEASINSRSDTILTLYFGMTKISSHSFTEQVRPEPSGPLGSQRFSQRTASVGSRLSPPRPAPVETARPAQVCGTTSTISFQGAFAPRKGRRLSMNGNCETSTVLGAAWTGSTCQCTNTGHVTDGHWCGVHWWCWRIVLSDEPWRGAHCWCWRSVLHDGHW